jgi:hypothetical protein
MEILNKILQWLPYVFLGFIVFAITARIAAKISIKTFFEEKRKEKTKAKKEE